MADEAKPDKAAEAKAPQSDENVILPDDSKEEAPPETETPKGDETKDGKPREPEAKDDAAEKNRQGYIKRISQRDNTEQKLETEKQEALTQIDDERDKKLAALEWDQYITKVTQARRDIVADNERVQAQIPLFNPTSEDYNKEIFDRTMERYARDSLIADDNGDIIGYRVPLFDYLKEEADLFTAGTTSGSKKRTRAAAKMDAAADTVGGASNRRSDNEDDDPFLKGFNSYK